MRVLVLSNLYPPHFVGGYECGCQDVVEGLRARGHEVKVLTSTYKVGKPQDDGTVYRWLESDLEWTFHGWRKLVQLLKKETTNRSALRRLCRLYQPDVVYVWNLAYVSLSLSFTAQQIGLPVCYFVFDNYLAQWEERDAWCSLKNTCRGGASLPAPSLKKKLMTPLFNLPGLRLPSDSLDLRHAQFATEYLKRFALQAGKSVDESKVIHWGLDVTPFPFHQASRRPHRLLYVGQVVEHKGVHTAVEALKVIVKDYGETSAALTIAGGSVAPRYENYVRDLVSSWGLENHVRFTGLIPREQLPMIYQEHDVLVFPSVWDEPFGIILLEAMACGLGVVGTATGGSTEIMEDEVNSLFFPKENAEACAQQIKRLMDDADLFEKLRHNGRRTVEEKFPFQTTLDKIESALCEVAA